jgi:hypothetical protein
MRALNPPLGFLADSKFLVRVFLRLFSTGLACTDSLGEITCCNEAVHIRGHRATDKKTEPSNSEVVTALLLFSSQWLGECLSS